METFTNNDKQYIKIQIKVCQQNLEMLMDFAPNHPLVVKNTNKMIDLLEILEAMEGAN